MKKGDKVNHANLGEVELVGELGKGPRGTTIVKHNGHEIEASTVYLKPLPATDDQHTPSDSGTAGGN